VILIVDPGAAGGRGTPDLAEVERAITRLGRDHRTVRATGPAEVSRIARREVEGGERLVVILGDDGSVHGAVNGMVCDDEALSTEAVLAVLPTGPECDFARTFGLPEEPLRALGRLEGDVTYRMDVGKATCLDREGRELSVYFANVAEAGFGAEVVLRARRLRLGSARSRYFRSFWRTLGTYRRPTVTVESGTRRFEGRATNVVVANGQFHASGVKVSPRSFPGDGFMEVQVWAGPRSDAFTALPRMFFGEHLPHPNIVEYRVKSVTVDADRGLAVQADGLPLGLTPASFRVIPQVINVKL
jgi:diacylglycerol kinase (ATP)